MNDNNNDAKTANPGSNFFSNLFSPYRMFHKTSELLVSMIGSLSAGICVTELQDMTDNGPNIWNGAISLGGFVGWVACLTYQLKKLPQEYPEYKQETKIERGACELVKITSATRVVKASIDLYTNHNYLNLIYVGGNALVGYYITLAHHKDMIDPTEGSIMPWRERRYLNPATAGENLSWLLDKGLEFFWGFSLVDLGTGKWLTPAGASFSFFGIASFWSFRFCFTKSREYKDYDKFRGLLREALLFFCLFGLGVTTNYVLSLDGKQIWGPLSYSIASGILFFLHDKSSEFIQDMPKVHTQIGQSSSFFRDFFNGLKMVSTFPEILIAAIGALGAGCLVEGLYDLQSQGPTPYNLIMSTVGPVVWFCSIPLNIRGLRNYPVYQRELRLESICREMIKCITGVQAVMSFSQHYRQENYAGMLDVLAYLSAPYLVLCGHYHELNSDRNYAYAMYPSPMPYKDKLSFIFDRCLDFYAGFLIKDRYFENNDYSNSIGLNGWGLFVYILLVSRKIFLATCKITSFEKDIAGDFLKQPFALNMVKLLARRLLLFLTMNGSAFMVYDVIQAAEKNLPTQTVWKDTLYFTQCTSYFTLFCTYEKGRTREPLTAEEPGITHSILLDRKASDDNLPDTLMP